MNYTELVQTIRNYTEVDANAMSDSTINTFILLTENKILRDIDLDVFKLEVTGNLTQGNRFLTAPENILTHRYLMVRNGDDQEFLEFRDTSFMKQYWPDQTAQGVPKYYSVWDQNTFYVAPTPDANYAVELGYVYKPAQISPANPTTWVSQNAPEVLVYGCLIQAYSYTKGPEGLIQYFEKSYQQAIQSLGIEQQGRRRRDEYRDGMARVKIKSESPGP
jgi:hypothetical protein